MEECDLELDFAQFLKEAKTHASEKSMSMASSVHVSEEHRKPKKSWKTSMFSWMKANKKDEQQEQKQKTKIKTAYTKATRRQGFSSGPINGVKGCYSTERGRPKRPSSGPLSGLFYHRKKVEDFQMPYVSLGQLNSPRNLSNYGPVYLVT
ncbi:hypothetical protein LXL04_009101 [Taraxacum kok-saghyz]